MRARVRADRLDAGALIARGRREAQHRRRELVEDPEREIEGGLQYSERFQCAWGCWRCGGCGA